LANILAFDLIVLDIMMPVMDGMRALRQLRRDSNVNRNTPAFALTAYYSIEDQHRYLLAGFDYVLAKPLRPGHIEQALSQFKSRPTGPLRTNIETLSPTKVDLIDQTLTSQISEFADDARLEAIQSRFWKSIADQCKILEKSLPEAIRGNAPILSQFRRAVHAVKGACAAIGLARVAHISRRLQNAPPSEIAGLMQIFADALTESRPALTQALIRTRQFNTPMQMRRENESETSHHHENNRSAI